MTADTRLATLVGRADAIYRDYSLTTVREWKARTGGLAIGFMPIYIPCEILDAQGVLPVGLMGARDDLEIIKGDAYYQSYICHIPRSTIELDGYAVQPAVKSARRYSIMSTRSYAPR